MKNSIKILSLILLALFSNNGFSANANYTFTSSGWFNGATAISAPTLVNTDSVTVTSGTWTLSGNTSVKGVKLQGGTINLSSRTLSGRVTVTGSSTITRTSGSINGTLAIASGTLTLGNSLNVSRVNLKGGTLALGSNTLNSAVNVLSNSSLTSNTTGNIQALTLSAGTLTLAGRLVGTTITFSGGNLAIGGSMYILSSGITVTSDATLSGTSNGMVYFASNNSNLTINGGDLTIDGTELVADVTVFSSDNNIYTINGGIYALNYSSQHTPTSADATSHVIGTMRVYIGNGNTTAFPIIVGDATHYAPIQFTPTGNNTSGAALSTDTFANYFTINYFGSKNTNTAIDNTLVSASGFEYWQIITSSTLPAATITFFLNTTGTTYGKTTVGSTTNLSTDLELAQFNTSTNKWTLVASTVNSVTGAVSVASSSALAPNTFFTFGSTNARTNFLTPLPVSILDFSAKALESSIEVKWSTASEKNNALFVVEKSIDGQSWSAIGSLAGAQTSNVVNQYGLNDYKPVAGFQFYRLKQVDADGSVNYSKAIAVNFSKVSNLNVNIFPNPAQNSLNIQTDVQSSGEVNVQILNSMGELVYNQTLQAGLIQNIDIASFIPGVYYITVATESESKIVRLLKN